MTTTGTVLRVAILWHLHQPLYRDLRTRTERLPWVRLHAAKNYLDLARILADHPDVPQTVNLVPVLLEQLSDDSARDLFLELASSRPEDMGEEARALAVRNFFSCNRSREIQPVPRYMELLALRGTSDDDRALREAALRFHPQDLRDLQVLFLLAWTGNAIRGEREVAELRAKGRGYTEEEKTRLLARLREAGGEVAPAYGRLAREGNAELSTSPYFHPIMPLLQDLRAARESDARVALPEESFHRPRDAALHLSMGLRRHEETFGARPRGVWLSEGALSEEALGLLRAEGVEWTLSDVAVLRRSLGTEAARPVLLRPYRLRGEGTAVFFRDTTLSDLIGFTYARWNPSRAAADLIGRLRETALALGPDASRSVLTIALDGENAWGAYPDNGEPFLRALFAGLKEEPSLRPVTFSGALSEGIEAGALDSITAGSWVGGDFRCWVGHPEKNHAWDLLARARRDLGSEDLDPADPAHRSMLAAEGSDWFWWMGDDHPSEQRPMFDALYRDHLRNTYLLRNAPPPEDLEHPVAASDLPASLRMPAGPVEPVIDGRRTHYLEWLAAGRLSLQAGAMHGAVCPVREIRFGSSRATLYLLLDPKHEKLAETLGRLVLGVHADPLAELYFGPWGTEARGDPLGRAPVAEGVRSALGSVIEIALPVGGISAAEVRLRLSVHDLEGRELARFPVEGSVRIPLAEGASEDWLL